MNPAGNHLNQQQAQVLPPGHGPTWVAEQFVQKYYEVLEKHPDYIFRFYNDPDDKSTLTVIDMIEDRTPVPETGTEAIQERVAVTIQGAVAKPEFVDAQFSVGGGVLLQVGGTMQWKGFPRKFVQTFFLATQERGYYVLNDILRVFPPEKGAVEIRLPENGYATPTIPPGFIPLAPHPAATEVAAAPAAPPAVEPAVARSVEPAPAPIPSTALPTSAVPAAVSQQVAEPVQAPRELPKPVPTVAAPPVVSTTPLPVTQPPAIVPAKETPSAAPATGPAPKQASAPAPQNVASLNWAERIKLNLQASQPKPAATAAVPISAPAPKPAPVASQPPAASLARGATAAPSSQEKHEEKPQFERQRPDDRSARNKTRGIYVNKLPKDISASDLQAELEAEFSKYGKFAGRCVWTAPSSRYGTVAYIEFESMESVEAAIKEGNEGKIILREQPVNVQQMWEEYSSKQGKREESLSNGDRSGLARKNSSGSFKGGRGFSGEGGRGRREAGRGEGGERRGRFQGSRGRGRGGRDAGSGRDAPKDSAQSASAEPNAV